MRECVKEISVKKNGHFFNLFVTESGRVEYQIDNGEIFTAKQLKDGRVWFIKKQEIIIKDELVEIDGLDLSEDDFSVLKTAQDAILEEKQKQSMRKMDNERKEALRHIDSWKRKIRTYKDKNKQKQKYCIHDFRIGNDKYRFIEREIPSVGIVINPDYKISEKMDEKGGVPKKYGELIFWDYLFEGEGWKRVRVLSNNELICLDIIQKYGFFANPQEKKDKPKKGLFGRKKIN